MVCLLPTVTLPKLKLDGLVVSGPAVAPVPESGMVKLEFDAFDVTVMLPVAAPASVGSNETLKAALCPAARVKGVLMPLKLKPDWPEIPTCEIVRLDPPVLVTVSDRVCFTPIGTVPKLTLAGLEVSGPGAAPVAESEMFKVEFDAFEVTAMFPVTAPAADGANETLKVVL
jgi:hypothetical protein